MDTAASEIRRNLALAVEVAAENYLLAVHMLDGCIGIVARREIPVNLNMLLARADGTIVQALLRQFIYSSNQAYRICDQGASQLDIDINARRQFVREFRSLNALRNIADHTYDVAKNTRRKNQKASPQRHDTSVGVAAVDETSLIIMDGKILVGKVDLVPLGKHVLNFRDVAGWASMRSVASPAKLNDL